LRNYADNFLRYYRENDSEEKTSLKVKLKELLISQVYNLLLDCKEMFGDVYNYETYSEQEKVFDISGLDILNIALYFYQNNNFYTYNNEGVKIPIPFSDEFGNLLPPNLFVKDPYLCLGLSLDSFDGDSATLYTVDRLGYDKKLTDEENTKNIQLRWVHYYENENQYSVINKDSELKFDVRWYRYKTGAPSADQYSGMYWERTNLGITKTETRVKELELTEINNLKTYYLLFHYSPGSTSDVASEQTYTQNFIPEYTIEKTQNINKGLSASSNYSHMSYWTDEYLNKYNIPKDLAQHAFAGQHTTSITKYVDQSWEDIYKQGFVFHD
jgi:hypothetical protein